LATGGGRGITAAVAIALATRYRCRLELLGRSPLTEPEEGELLACPDAVALRRVLAGRNGKTHNPAALEAHVRRILAARAARATLAAIERGGGHAAYHACDVRDAVAFGALIEQVYGEHGRIDVVIHGAGVIEDRLLSAKTPESFDRVFGTKVRSARTLVEKLRDDVQMVVFFSSIAGACGNRGQTDYAAANDALDDLAHHLWRRLPGRVVSIGWGPWAGAGMVTPDLEREYARRGIDLIPPEEGVQRFLEELTSPDAAHVVVVHRSAAKILSP
jgi:NAD(P)-dependent dehydrogenase (short-subunit alcohol dehydrogenase family)